MRRTPKTRYPWSAERFYAKQLIKLVDQLGKLTLSMFDEQIKPQIKLYRMRTDSEIRNDAPLDVIQHAVDLIKALSLGIFSTNDMMSIASRFMLNLNQQSKANADSQARVHGIDPIQTEPWLDQFMRGTVHENVSYISSIRDEYFPKIENIIYQGVKRGQSITDMRNDLVDRIGMTKNRAQFIAVDQTGTIFGQMTARRHQEMGVKKFEWVDAGDNRVRPKHRDLNEHTFSYDKPPSEGLPGEPYRCRCVAYPVFDDSDSSTSKTTANFKEFANEDEVKAALGTEQFINSLTDSEKQAITRYTTSAYEAINGYLRHQYRPINKGETNSLDQIVANITSALNKARISDNIRVWREVQNFDFVEEPRPGKKFGDLGFVSTTPLPKESSFIGMEKDDRMVIIDVPKGTHGAYIESLTDIKGEKEFLLQKGMAFEIMKIDGDKMFCRVVGEMSQNDKPKNDSAKEIRKDDKKNKRFNRSERFIWKKGDVIELN